MVGVGGERTQETTAPMLTVCFGLFWFVLVCFGLVCLFSFCGKKRLEVGGVVSVVVDADARWTVCLHWRLVMLEEKRSWREGDFWENKTEEKRIEECEVGRSAERVKGRKLQRACWVCQNATFTFRINSLYIL